MSKPLAAPRRWAFWHALRGRPSLAWGIVVLVLVGSGGALAGMKPVPAFLVGFDCAAVVYLVAQWRAARSVSPAAMRERARRADFGRWGTLWGGVVCSAVVLVALGTELQANRSGGVADLVIAVASIVLGWLFLNTLFALHYAHGYYGDRGPPRHGLEFPGTEQPDYWDFAYFAMVIGMTFQVSDVQVTGRELRRTVLLHGLVAFFFNVFVIAISVNLVAGRGAG